jgi:type II secretory pathway pseudopilin PulG
MPACRNRRRRSDEQGYLLIEVLAAMTILSILVLGLANLWSVLGGLSFSQVLRQKAVFVLNGEMERLNWLYTTSSFGAGTRLATIGYPTISNVPGSALRLVYDTTSTNASFVVTASASLQASNAAVWETGIATTARNYVWLDQDRGILARLSWIELPLSQCGNAGGGVNLPCTCYPFLGIGTSFCLQLLLVLDYPFTIQGGVAVQMPGQTLRTLTLRTIVGRRA